MKENKKVIPYPMECYYDFLREALTDYHANGQILLKQMMFNLNKEITFLAKYEHGGERLLEDITHRSRLRSLVRKLLTP